MQADNDYEVHWSHIIKAARVPKVNATTAARNMKKAGYKVAWRTPRAKPWRTEAAVAERKRICNVLRKHPESFWQKRVDLFMDNKKWDVPTSARGKKYVRTMRIRGHLRKPSEGLKKAFTKPHPRKHKTNTGGKVNLCAGIINGRVRVWHYLPKTWNKNAAVALYRDVIAPALKKHRGNKRTYVILEDNDPTGYKSNDAKSAKATLKIEPLAFPTYSPDLNPCDFSLWEEVQARMDKQKPPPREGLDAFKARLRKTAMAIPEKVIRNMVQSIKGRAQSIYENDGGHISRD